MLNIFGNVLEHCRIHTVQGQQPQSLWKLAKLYFVPKELRAEAKPSQLEESVEQALLKVNHRLRKVATVNTDSSYTGIVGQRLIIVKEIPSLQSEIYLS